MHCRVVAIVTKIKSCRVPSYMSQFLGILQKYFCQEIESQMEMNDKETETERSTIS